VATLRPNNYDLCRGYLFSEPSFSQPTDFGCVDLEIGQNPCQLSITHSLHGADTKLLPEHRVPVGLIPARSGVWIAGAANSPLIPQAGQGSAIQARPQPGQWPFPEVWEGCRLEDASQWREIRECMATVAPMEHGPQLVRECGHRRRHAKENLPGGVNQKVTVDSDHPPRPS
jgi:hypothetical protein